MRAATGWGRGPCLPSDKEPPNRAGRPPHRLLAHELALIRRTRSGLFTADDLWESALKLIYRKLPAHISTDRFIEVGE